MKLMDSKKIILLASNNEGTANTKEHIKPKDKIVTKKEENLPSWFGADLEKGEMSKEQQDELDKLFKEFD